MNLLTTSKSKAKVVVGVDFGTTFSGFAYALVAEPEVVRKFYEWPDLGPAGALHYCKTQTSLLYEAGSSAGSYVLLDWGYSARVKHARIKTATHFLTLFKLHLAGGEAGTTTAAALPEGLTPRRVISDYLRKLSEFMVTTIQNSMGNHITMEDLQWCLTVPAIWDDRAKQEMKIFAAMAGMTKGAECPPGSIDTASPHPVMIVIEPEAASLYCQRKVQCSLSCGDQFLIVDVGGGTVDLVLHEKIGAGSGLKVREVSPSSGGLCGGSFVDQAFFEFLSRKIRCFQEFSGTHSESILKLKGWWETIKYGFDGNMDFSYELELPGRLARAWEAQESSRNLISDVNGPFDFIELSLSDMLSLFDPVVNKILQLIESKMMEGSNVKAMMIVGDFSGSPYLVNRIKQEFSTKVETIVVPEEPGSAICCGAVYYGVYGADAIMSRMSKKTYGIDMTRSFYLTDPPNLLFQNEDGESLCKEVFSVYTKRNEEIPLDHHVSHTYYPIRKSQTEMEISLFSTVDSNPKYVCDPGVTKEGTFHITFPSENELGQVPEVLVSMYFGRTMIEVQAKGQNFGEGEKFKMPPVTFEKTLE